MKKILFWVVVSVTMSLSSLSWAGVTFLPAAEGSVGSVGSGSLSSGQRCINEGYSITSCDVGQRLNSQCPYNGGYYKNCCPEEYNYTPEECTRAGLRTSRNSCGGLYKCM